MDEKEMKELFNILCKYMDIEESPKDNANVFILRNINYWMTEYIRINGIKNWSGKLKNENN